jgi:hypothetical protein
VAAGRLCRSRRTRRGGTRRERPRHVLGEAGLERDPCKACRLRAITKPSDDPSLFPSETREVQFDEKWSYVGKKEKNCNPEGPDDAKQGDCRDHVAFDPEHKLVVSVVPGKRSEGARHAAQGPALRGRPPAGLRASKPPESIHAPHLTLRPHDPTFYLTESVIGLRPGREAVHGEAEAGDATGGGSSGTPEGDHPGPGGACECGVFP